MKIRLLGTAVRSFLPTFWIVVIIRVFDMIPNSSTFDAKNTQVGASSNGSILFSEFLA